MKILIINYQSFLRYFPILLLVILLVCLIGSTGLNALGVFSTTDRDLPIYSVETDKKEVAITFDCAWGADDIPQILNTLRQSEVKAAFFIVGQWAEKNPDAVKRISDEGHDIANHSYSHLRMGVLDRGRLVSEIQKCRRILDELSGTKTDLFRAPYGDYTNNTVAIARDSGYFTIQWNLDSLDWKPEISKSEIMNRITTKIAPGSIILFHNDTKYTSELLPDIIVALKNKGYSFLPLSKMIIRENFYIDHTGRQFLKK